MKTRKIERTRIAKMTGRHGGLEDFCTVLGGVGIRATMRPDGTVDLSAQTLDPAGRRKSVLVAINPDNVARLYHSLGEAMKARGVFVELESDDDRYARIASENDASELATMRIFGAGLAA